VELSLPVTFHILTSRSDGSNSIGAAGQKVSAYRGPAQNMSQMLLKSIQDIIGVFIWAACSSATRS